MEASKENSVANETSRKWTLDKIVLEYEIALFDTSALMSPFYKDALNPTVKAKADNEQYICRATDFLHHYAGDGKISVTPEIFQEYVSCIDQNYHIGKKVKNGRSNLTRDVLSLMRARTEKRKLKNKLRDLIESSGSVIQFNEEERKIYESMTERFGDLRDCYGVREINLSFLISGLVLSRKRGSTALVSNNFKIFNFFRHLRGFCGINSDRMNFFIRRDINLFEALYKKPVHFKD